ncbi:phage tail protein I [Candidatus Albibeggiatoa sp. nov. NOAA]|uniref:phage tail protein I n=1 Tax=Candidatus Albibeggiatoa sp. nov. NOAA TaxID=3162724 RepID=UPI0032F64334|nr:phage tail protein I [Thiotrichaceae bacterium]
MQSILPSHSTQLELDIEQIAAEHLDSLPVHEIRNLWNPWECPAEFLPWLAWAMSVDVWDEDWLDQVKRRVIAESYEIHRKKGTRWAVQRILELTGVPDFEIVEWWQTSPKGTPRTFFLIVHSDGRAPYPLSYEQYQRISKNVDLYKPASAHYDLVIRTIFKNVIAPYLEDGKIKGSALSVAAAVDSAGMASFTSKPDYQRQSSPHNVTVAAAIESANTAKVTTKPIYKIDPLDNPLQVAASVDAAHITNITTQTEYKNKHINKPFTVGLSAQTRNTFKRTTKPIYQQSIDKPYQVGVAINPRHIFNRTVEAQYSVHSPNSGLAVSSALSTTVFTHITMVAE